MSTAEWSNVLEGRRPHLDLTINPDIRCSERCYKVDVVEVDLPEQSNFFKSTIQNSRLCRRVDVPDVDLSQLTFCSCNTRHRSWRSVLLFQCYCFWKKSRLDFWKTPITKGAISSVLIEQPTLQLSYILAIK